MQRFKRGMAVVFSTTLLMSSFLPVSGSFAAAEVNGLERVYLTDSNKVQYEENATIDVLPGVSRDFDVKGLLAGGIEVDFSDADVTYESSRPHVASVDEEGIVNAIADGVAKITATVTHEGESNSSAVYMQVRNPEDRFVDSTLHHDKMTIEIGEPAILELGDRVPSIELDPFVDGKVIVEYIRDGKVLKTLKEVNLKKGKKENITVPGNVKGKGHHELHLIYNFDGETIHDSFYFKVLDNKDISKNESKIAYVGSNGKLEYTPDFKGNTILDYSNAGYQGGGVKIPDVEAKIVVSPIDGDNTANIQEAINQVSEMPMNESGFRGAVVLTKGTFEISTPLKIQTSGVVLRGQGQDEENGTILLSTTKERINMLELKGTEGIKLNEETVTKISELYVPVGTRSFHVEDPSEFKVGDEIIVRRFGNEHWIHEIDMDQIVKDPGPDTDGTLQWEPFNHEFDRVITAINGNIVTIDAPIASSIEERFGGAEILKYSDARIENIGVENIRFDTVFDKSVTREHNGETYYADEDHANTAVNIANAKNVWVREITGLHLRYSLVDATRTAKWVTIQDTESLEMVSQLTGSRRYPYKFVGQLVLLQRAYSDKARHSFLIDSRVMGPNVILDSKGENEYNKSEPHHRWSVGGLFDNVESTIAIQDRQWYGTGHGWSGANNVAWNTKGVLIIQQPPTAQNYSIGHVGEIKDGDWPREGDMRPREQGYVESHGQHVEPRSLYLKQLEDRLGKEAVNNIARTPVEKLEVPN